ncbi:hypothetical protein [Pseudogracilibacillus sp. SO30301A]|uniref:hypothetical protein n=1 Tax=Pseudogracilibacillus sp. SO30301A TaxID=3098291 RepID=UPI00300E441F
MKTIILTGIGIISGIVLAGFLKVIQLITNNDAYVLLFNADYIPVLKHFPYLITGVNFHFAFAGAIVLLFGLKGVGFEKKIWIYLLVYSVESAMLFSLTSLKLLHFRIIQHLYIG